MSLGLPSIITTRLSLSPLSEVDAELILNLLNTEGWLQFIGERNIKSLEDALAYIRKIRLDSSINYWAGREKESNKPIGVFTFIKRSYLNHHDIGFGLLPEFMNKGYALEGAKALVNEMTRDNKHKQVLATVFRENDRSIKLLQKLGLEFERKIELDGKIVDLYKLNLHTSMTP
ncbi:MAG: GNAT family N-acetyltransferase [Chryseolinea sp.]